MSEEEKKKPRKFSVLNLEMLLKTRPKIRQIKINPVYTCDT